jgi:hypothetical protein
MNVRRHVVPNKPKNKQNICIHLFSYWRQVAEGAMVYEVCTLVTKQWLEPGNTYGFETHSRRGQQRKSLVIIR